MGFKKPFRAVPVVPGARYRNRNRRGGKGKVVPFRRRRKAGFALLPALLGIAIVTAAIVAGIAWFKAPRAAPDVPQAAIGRMSGPDVFACRVARITDGDSLRCADGTRVRLNAVAAREIDGTCSPGHPCPPASAEAATAELARLAGGQTLQCRQTGTSYNRKAAICVNEDGVEINCAMVRSGTTLVWPRFARENPICVY